VRTFLQKLSFSLLAFAVLCSVANAEAVNGTVTNRTTGKLSPGDDVVLLKLAQGMQELARTKTDGKGRFIIEVPQDGLHLLRVTHDKANYFKPIQPGTQSVEIDVYSASDSVEGITLDADVMRIQTEPGGKGLKVVEHFFVKNSSSPAKTLMSEHPFELYLPAGATVEGSAAKAPGGMAVQSGLVPMGDPNHFTILFPLRPGESEFQVTYKLPYSGSFSFQPRPVIAVDNLVVMMPKSMTFKAGPSAPYAPVAEEVDAQTFLARSVQPSQPLTFTVSGAGELPRDAGAGSGATPDPAAAAGAAGAGGAVATVAAGAAAGDPARDTRPGGGLGVPVDKDADRDPWTKYRWWIIAAVALVFAAAAGVMLKNAQPTGTTVAAAPGVLLPHTGGALQVLRDELFAVETDRLAGKLTEAQYAELKQAYDVVLRRAIARAGA